MTVTRYASRLILSVVVIVVLTASGASFGESGCHRNGGTGGSGHTASTDTP